MEFSHREEAAKAVLEETISIDGRKAHIHYAKPKEGEDLPFRIHIANLPRRTNGKVSLVKKHKWQILHLFELLQFALCFFILLLRCCV